MMKNKSNLQPANWNWNDCKLHIHCNMLQWFNPRGKILRKNSYSTSSKKLYIEQDDRTAHWICHSKLKIFYYKGFFNGKIIIDELEGGFTGAPIDATNNGVTAVDVDVDYDEDIISGAMVSKINESINKMEIDIEVEQKTEKYKVALNINIEIFPKLKISTIIIKNIGGQYKTSYNNISLMKLTFSLEGFF